MPAEAKRRHTTAQTPDIRPTDGVDGRARVVIDRVHPCVDAGRFAIKRVVGETVDVRADIIADGHDVIGAEVIYRPINEHAWQRAPLACDVNDGWSGRFEVTSVGRWEYAVRAWIDRFATWRHDLEKKAGAGQDVEVELKGGEELVREAAEVAEGEDALELREMADQFVAPGEQRARVRVALTDHLAELMRRHLPQRYAVTLDPPLRITVDRPRALFSAWYEVFPRSCADEPGRHGTFEDLIKRLPYISNMGFDVLYLPPVHPIGRTHRKGPNNAPTAGPDDPGSPWAIGGPEGGHKAVHPELGTLDDFKRLVAAADMHGLEVALDIAFQCSPDHPWVAEHPQWFRHRADGTIQYAENPPKKYQDIYPIDFETSDWKALWAELKSVFEFWIEQGVRIFRVDNPHTKAFRFWDWCIDEIKSRHPDVIFLSEAFTRPKRMYRLAKGGFTQSYTYFAWRNGPRDLEQYMYDLTRTDVVEYFRPSFWPNTPDILTAYLQEGGRPAAMARVVLAGTLSASYGIYGPVYELCDFAPREPGSEENLNSEKYQIRHWELDNEWSLAPFIRRLNEIRREHPALQHNRDINFHHVDNPALVAYSKRSRDGRDVILCCVSTNPFQDHWGTVHLDLDALGLSHDEPFDVEDLLCGTRFTWHGPHNVIGLGPSRTMAHIFRVFRHARTESDFDYFD